MRRLRGCRCAAGPDADVPFHLGVELVLVQVVQATVGVVHEEEEPGPLAGGRPLKHLEIPIRVAEGGDGPERVFVEFDMAESDRNRVVLDPGDYEFDYLADRRPSVYRTVTDQPQSGPPTGSVEPSA